MYNCVVNNIFFRLSVFFVLFMYLCMCMCMCVCTRVWLAMYIKQFFSLISYIQEFNIKDSLHGRRRIVMVLSPVVVIIREFCLQHCRRHYHCLRFRCRRLRHRLGATRRLTRHTLLLPIRRPPPAAPTPPAPSPPWRPCPPLKRDIVRYKLVQVVTACVLVYVEGGLSVPLASRSSPRRDSLTRE